MIEILKDIWYALTSPEKYQEFMNYKKSNLLLYVFLLVFASGIISMGIPAAEFMAAGGFESVLNEGIPNFRASSSEGFWIEEPIEIDEYGFLIKADSNIIRDDITDLDGQYGTYEYVIMVDKEKVHISTPGTEEVTARFDEMPGFSFSKDDIIQYIPLMYLSCIGLFLFALLIDYGYYLMVAVIISWMSGLIASFLRVRIKNTKLFKMAVYAGTFSYIVSVIQLLIGHYIPNFTFFSYVITLGYMFFAIKEYKENGIEELPPEQFGSREDK